jgi:hypothetical protein
MEDSKQKGTLFIRRVCILSYIRLGIIILFILSYFFEITDRDFWWPILGSFTPDLFAILLLVQFGALTGTYLIGKKGWIGFSVYSFFHIIHFSLLIIGVYNLSFVTLSISFMVMVLFIILFIIGLKKPI